MPFKKRSEMTPDELAADQARRALAGASRRARTVERQFEAANGTPPDETVEVGDGEEDFGLDDLLSDQEIAAIYAEAKKKVAEERKKQRVKEIFDRAFAEERKNAGLMDRSEEERALLTSMTQVTIDLPRFKNQNDVPFLRIDGKGYYHGRTYTITVAEARTINEMMGRQWLHIAQFYGESRHYFDPHRGKSVYMGGPASGGVLQGAAA